MENIKLGYWFAGGSTPANAFDSSLYTHLCFAFVDLNPLNSTVTVPGYAQGQIGSFVQTVRRKNRNVKTLISIGGGGGNNSSRNEICTAFSRMAATAQSRAAFIKSSLALAKEHKFDGLDLDWEYPGKSDGNPSGYEMDMTNFGLLLDELRRAAPRGFLLAAAVYYSNPLNPYWGDWAYPTQSINDNLDWIFVMSYDLYGPWEDTINNPAPLRGSWACGDTGIRQWKSSAVNARKIVYGLPSYGYKWKLINPQSHNVGDNAIGQPPAMEYPTIAHFVANNRSTVNVVYNQNTTSVCAYNTEVWIGYDDERSTAEKVKYARDEGLGGYGFWTVNNSLATAAYNAW